jgi:hypothetical protein
MEHFRNYQGGSQGGGSRRSGYRRSGYGGYRRPVVRQNLGGTGGGPWWGWQYGYYIPSNYPFFEYNPYVSYVPYEVEVVEVEKKPKVEKKVENFESVKYVYPEFLK